MPELAETSSTKDFPRILPESLEHIHEAQLHKAKDRDFRDKLKGDPGAQRVFFHMCRKIKTKQDVWHEHYVKKHLANGQVEIRCLDSQGRVEESCICSKKNAERLLGAVSGMQGEQKEAILQVLYPNLRRNKHNGKGIDFFVRENGFTTGTSVKSLSLTAHRHENPEQIKNKVKEYLESLEKFLGEEGKRGLEARTQGFEVLAGQKAHPPIEKGILLLALPEGLTKPQLQAIKAALQEFGPRSNIEFRAVMLPTMTH